MLRCFVTGLRLARAPDIATRQRGAFGGQQTSQREPGVLQEATQTTQTVSLESHWSRAHLPHLSRAHLPHLSWAHVAGVGVPLGCLWGPEGNVPGAVPGSGGVPPSPGWGAAAPQ